MMVHQETGTYNMTNPGIIEHNDILELYKKHIDKKFLWQNFDIIEQSKILKSERSNNYLDTTKLENYCNNNNIIINRIKESIIRLFKNGGF